MCKPLFLVAIVNSMVGREGSRPPSHKGCAAHCAYFWFKVIRIKLILLLIPFVKSFTLLLYFVLVYTSNTIISFSAALQKGAATI